MSKYGFSQPSFLRRDWIQWCMIMKLSRFPLITNWRIDMPTIDIVKSKIE
jgi:hypothetical protein